MERLERDTLLAHYNSESLASGEDNDCAVRALAAVSGVSYSVVNKWLIDGGYRRPKGRTFNFPYFDFLEAQGIPARIAYAEAKTIRSFQKLRLKGKYLVRVKGHILAVIDGEAIDWADQSLRRITAIIKVYDK